MQARQPQNLPEQSASENIPDLERKLLEVEARQLIREKKILGIKLDGNSPDRETALKTVQPLLLPFSGHFFTDISRCFEIFHSVVNAKIATNKNKSEYERWHNLACRAAGVGIRISWLHTVFHEYLLDRHSIEESDIKQLLKQGYSAYSFFEAQHLKIISEFLGAEYDKYFETHIHTLPQSDLYVFFVIRDRAISLIVTDNKTTVDVSAAKFKTRSLERLIRAAQSPIVACRAILFLATSLVKVLSYEPNNISLGCTMSSDEILHYYKKNIEKIEGHDLLSEGLRHNTTLLKTYLSSLDTTKRYIKSAKKRHRHQKSTTDSLLISLIDPSGAEELTKKLLLEYEQCDSAESISLITLYLAYAAPIDIRDAHLGIAGSYLFLAWSTIKIHLLLIIDILDCIEKCKSRFKHISNLDLLQRAWRSGARLDKFIIKHDLYFVVTSAEWLEYTQIIGWYLALHKQAVTFSDLNKRANNYANIFKKFDASDVFEPRKECDDFASLHHILQKVADAVEIVRSKREKKAQDFYLSLQSTEKSAQKKMSMTLFRQKNQENRTVITGSARSENPMTGDNNNEASKLRRQDSDEKLNSAAKFLMEGDIEQAIQAFTECASTKAPDVSNALRQIKSAWGLGECYQALAKQCLNKQEKSRLTEKAKQHIANALDLVKKALLIFTEQIDAKIYQQLITDRSYLIYILENDFQKNHKSELRHIRSGLYYESAVSKKDKRKSISSTSSNIASSSSTQLFKADKPVTHIRDINFNINPQFTILVTTLINHHVDFYIYGGAVRDWLVGLSPRDIDICASLSLEKLSDLLLQNGYYFEKLGLDHPLIQISLGDIVVEISSNSQKQSSYAAVTAYTSPNSAASFESVDATINAFRFYPATKKLVCLSQSLVDLENKRIGLFANQQISKRLEDDPSLHFRFVSLAAKLGHHGFTIDPSLLLAMRRYSTLLPSMTDKDKHRCFVQFCRSFTQGRAQKTWNLLNSIDLLKKRSPKDQTMIELICRKLDQVVSENKTPSLSLLIAALLWQPLQDLLGLNSDSNESPMTEIESCLDTLMRELDVGMPHARIIQRVKNTLALCLLEQYPARLKIHLNDSLSYEDFLLKESLIDAWREANLIQNNTLGKSLSNTINSTFRA